MADGVMLPTEPANIEWARVVLVMALSFPAADLAGLPFDLATTHRVLQLPLGGDLLRVGLRVAPTSPTPAFPRLVRVSLAPALPVPTHAVKRFLARHRIPAPLVGLAAWPTSERSLGLLAPTRPRHPRGPRDRRRRRARRWSPSPCRPLRVPSERTAHP